MSELALHIMDIMQNSITAGSNRIAVKIHAEEDEGTIHIVVEDDGCGMDEETRQRAVDPRHMSRGTQIMGMGLPRLKEAALLTGGDLLLQSEPGKGTCLKAVFVTDALNRPPLGNVGNVFFLTMLSYEHLMLELELRSSRGTYIFDSRRFQKQLLAGGKSSMDAAFHAETIINCQTEAIFKKVLPEMAG